LQRKKPPEVNQVRQYGCLFAGPKELPKEGKSANQFASGLS
jgi:hypothetical protein